MRVLWTHNFDPVAKNAGAFMKTCAEALCKMGAGVELCYLGNLRSIRNLLRSRKFVKNIASRYDLVHAQYGSACAVVSAGAEGAPKILTLRGNDWSTYGGKIGFHYVHSRLARMMTISVLRKFNAVVTVSRRMREEVQGSYPESRVYNIASPINLERFVPLDKMAARKALGYENNNEKWILFTALSKSEPVKRFKLAKQAVAKASLRMGNLRLRVASDISQEDMPAFVASCDMVLCTSENEGWPNSIKEALACNLPFVSTDVSDLGYIAGQEPVCRICCADADVIADNICEVLSQKTETEFRRYVLEMSLPTIAGKMLDLYKSVIAQG